MAREEQHRHDLYLDERLWGAVEQARGLVPRNAFLVSLLETHPLLSGQSGQTHTLQYGDGRTVQIEGSPERGSAGEAAQRAPGKPSAQPPSKRPLTAGDAQRAAQAKG